ncbi:GON-4-like protein isoform X2 [Siniperca chuatsi]|uniref:GON-4-like protein isoform X2 n=1 Tax=Siniperca chuatsi TaxID=119488 RepID=UPI001CE049BC|nr:GON-4-like protein isoform X2 [Siniperca chuatsi]
MATGISVRMERRRPAEEDVCPLESKSLRTVRENIVFRLDRKSQTASTPHTESSTEDRQEVERTSVSGGGMLGEEVVTMATSESSEDELGRLDIDLDRKSKQHNLTTSNVRTILHEVITHECVVAMMKAAIRDTQDLPMFEPKMTRSRLKQAVQQGQPLNWSLSVLNTATVKPPQFVDIDLEEDEGSSDEEYCPDEEEEEEEDTAEETFLSDADSLASPPRMHQSSQPKLPPDHGTDEPLQRCPGHLREQVMTSTCAPQHLLTAPESSFLERLNAVEEELDCSPAYTYNQSLDRKAADDDDDDDDGGGGDEGSSCLAYRTRSKLRLVNIPLGQLEAELLAPDITDDMYEQSAAQQEEDRHWTKWLQSLMAPDNEEEADDDDDPEYNFLEDLDEPDLEDYRTDRAVQITKKEVNELLEELFDTLQEEEVAAEEEEQQEEEALSQTGPKFNIPQALRFEAPLASMLTERRRTVRKQYEALQQRRALQDTTNHHRENINLKDTASPQPETITSVLVLPSRVCPALHLDYTQKLQLQQQIQQHVQLLTQVHLLGRRVDALNHEACITKHYLEELQQFASRREEVFLPSSFRVCNLQGALDLLQEVEQRSEPPPVPPASAASRRWLPKMTPATNSHAFPLLPVDTAWLFATRPVFLYPELLPVCSLDPALHTRHHRSVYTGGEDGLIVLGLKHFEGTVQSDQLISSYLLCKTRWNFRKHVREMSGPRAPHNNVIKTFLTQRVVPPLPLACNRVQPGDQRPPVDRNTSKMPNWLKNSQLIIQKTRLNSTGYPPSLPLGCNLRLHPYWLNKSRPPLPPHRRLFTLAHNASLLPLAKAPADRQVERQVDMQPISYLSLPPPGVTLLSDSPAVSGALALPPTCGAVPLAAVKTVPTHPVCTNIIQSCLPIGQRTQRSISRQQDSGAVPLLLPLPLPSLTNPDTTNPITHCSAAAVKPGYFLLQMMWTPPPAPPTFTSQHALGQQLHGPIKEEQEEMEQTSTRPRPPLEEKRQVEEESSASPSTLSPLSSCAGEEEENWTAPVVVTLNGGENTGEEEEERGEGGGGVGEGGEEEAGEGGEGEQGGEGEDEDEGQREDGGGEREEDEEKDKDEDQDRQGEEEEEEEDFDDLTQDEDEEEVMSSASEESVLSVPELQETMKQLTWLAAERRLCADGDSEEDHSPTSPGSQEEEEEEEEEEGRKGEQSGEGRSSKAGRDEETPSGEGTPRGGGRCPGRGRGRSRPLRGLRRSRQERHSKDAAKLLLLYDENILDNDPHRESKDVAFAQSYLNRVREALQDVPGQVEEFVSLLNEFEQVGEGQEVMLFRKLRCILGDRTDLLRDFAAFLHPEQALLCGLFEEQQAFERSRRFLRQLEISFGDNPSHYQKIIKALQTGPDLSPTSIHELKAQMATLLKGHTHLQAEFWVFFDELRPPPARPGQFEEAHWPEDGGGGSDGGEGVSQVSGGGASSGFEEVTLPELEEEEEGHKIQPMTSRRQRRKMDAHRNYKDCDWSDKDWPCLCRDAKIRRHRRKGCSHCHSNKTSGGVSRAMKSLDPLYSQISSTHDEPGDKDLDLKGDDDSPQPDRSVASWEGAFPLIDEKEEEEELDDEEEDEGEEERKNSEKAQSSAVKRSRREEALQPPTSISSITSPTSPSITSSIPSISSVTPITSSMISSVTPITSSMISSVTPITSSMISHTSISTSSIISSIFTSTSVTPSLSSSPSFCTSSSTSPTIFSSSITTSISPSVCTSSASSTLSSSSAPPRPSPPPDLPVCAKNISLTASGEKVILWTREADRVILTTCQQEGANQNTFQAISTLLGNKTPSEVSRRFRDLMSLFRTAAGQTSSEDKGPPTEPLAANEEEDGY